MLCCVVLCLVTLDMNEEINLMKIQQYYTNILPVPYYSWLTSGVPEQVILLNNSDLFYSSKQQFS